MPLGLKNSSTSGSGEQQNGVYTNDTSDFEKNGHAATICVGVIISVAVLVLCGLLCYRQINRRRKLSGINQEKARRASIRQAVRLKLEELDHVHDSTPGLRQTEIKPSSVTFGDVVLINPSHSTNDSPVPQHRRNYGNYTQHQQLYHKLHHQSIYNGSKRRVHHIPYRRDYSQMTYRQQQHVQSLQGHLKINEEHTIDNKIFMYPNSDHHRLSVHKQIEPKTDHAREVSVSSANILQMHNNEHHKLSLHKKAELRTEHIQEKPISTANILHMHNNEHHKLSLHKKAEPTTEHVHEKPASSANSSQTNRVQIPDDGTMYNAVIVLNSSDTFNRKVVLHNGHSQRIGKRYLSAVPIGMDAVY